MHRVWHVFGFPVFSFFDIVLISKVSISLRTSFKNQHSLHVAHIKFPARFLGAILITFVNIVEYFGLLFRDLFLCSSFYRFWLHFGSKNGLSELTQITPGTTLGATTWIFGLEDTAKAPQGHFCVLIWRLFGRFFTLIASVLTWFPEHICLLDDSSRIAYGSSLCTPHSPHLEKRTEDSNAKIHVQTWIHRHFN